MSQNKYEDAKPLLSRVLQIYTNAYGVDRALVKRTQALLNLIARKQAAEIEGPIPISDYLAKVSNIPPQAQILEVALQLNYLGSLFYGQGKIEQAEKVYSWALAATALSCGRDTTLTASCLNDYAQVLRSAGREVDAKQLELDAHNILANSLSRQASLSLP
jgi:tetratricopeptide (TPR) repeat protein